MWGRPTAIGYLRRDVSGVSQVWDETQIRSVAKRLGYELAKIVVFGAQTERPVSQLLDTIERVGADAVVTPTPEHLGDELDRVVRVCDVITVNPENTYARWVLPADRWPAPGFNGEPAGLDAAEAGAAESERRDNAERLD
ncbi:hypothetical protein DFR70_12465 [Nocardia tenerifensis]|uniref:Uncharacterized protein n=2 Tax=Nocardia tenerifensis TaxID=228006 RepID=A0A318JMX2_9NOCA|nr:hypothetical protein DFR70_12465 [Nocardia tenerifensis]